MFNFTAPFVPNNVFVIGAGGTGSRLVPLLAQFLRSITRGKSPTGWVENPTIWLTDFDTVEEKNLMRQNFIRTDIGKNKAVVLAERYERAFDTRIIPITERVSSTGSNADAFREKVGSIMNVLNPSGEVGYSELFNTSIVIICVDSVQARRDILNTFCVHSSFNNNTFFIDAGNEDDFGQVSFFTSKFLTHVETYNKLTDEQKLPKIIPYTHDIDYIPMDFNYYKDLKDTESTASCAELNQTLAINALMATNIMGIVQNYFYRKPMNYHCVRVDLKGGNSVDYNSFNNFRRRALTNANLEQIEYYGANVVEKDGTTTPLLFAMVVERKTFRDWCYMPLRKQFLDAEEAMHKAKQAEAEALKATEVKVSPTPALMESLIPPPPMTPPSIPVSPTITVGDPGWPFEEAAANPRPTRPRAQRAPERAMTLGDILRRESNTGTRFMIDTPASLTPVEVLGAEALVPTALDTPATLPPLTVLPRNRPVVELALPTPASPAQL